MPRRRFVRSTPVRASARALFDWHEAPGAFERLTPPWERVVVVSHEGGIRDGARVVLRVGPAPFALRWELEHRDYDYGRQFCDQQVRGPFAYWRHVHTMRPDGPDRAVLEDAIEYELPFGWLGDLIGGPIVRWKLKRLFDWRHAVTRDAFGTSTTGAGT